MSPAATSSIDWKSFSNIVDGKPRSSKNIHNGINPVTGEKLWDVPIGSQQDVDDAVEAAQRAFKAYKKYDITQRQDLLKKFGEHFKKYESDMIDLLCAETGKPRQFATVEVQGVYAHTAHHASLTLPEETFEDDRRIVKTTYKPLGVVGGIIPWNFPIFLSYGKICPALISGCAIIIKPSPYTPYTGLKLVEIINEVFPPGLVQAIGGDDKLGPMLTAHPNIQKISFTGSIPTGKKIMEACAKTLKRVTLELGGNDAAIVLPDVDIAKTAPKVALAGFLNSGQICVCTKRVFIHQSIYKEFLAAMIEFTKSLKLGASDDKGVMLGPIQNSMQYEKVKEFFADSKAKGYTFAHGAPDVAPGKGYFIQPTLIDNPPNDSKIIQEEPFGPIVPCQPWTDEAEVIERANNTNTGLGACVYGKDVAHAQRIGDQLEAGSVFINGGEEPTPQATFGGHKESGIGAEWGPHALMSYCNPHAMHTFKS